MFFNERVKELRRGDVYYITSGSDEYCGMKMGRPAVVVSSDMGLEKNKATVMVIFCTTNLERFGSHYVKLTSTARVSLAKCNEIFTVERANVGDYMCTLNEFEMKKIDEQISWCLGLSLGYNEPEDEEEIEYEDEIEPAEAEDYEDENVALRVENSLYKKLYEKAMEQLVELKFSRECVPTEPIKEVAPAPKKTVKVETVAEPPIVKANVNTDTVQEIVQKIGLNMHTAREIVRYRRVHGGYRTLEDLLICPRIGKVSLEKWRDKFEV